MSATPLKPPLRVCTSSTSHAVNIPMILINYIFLSAPVDAKRQILFVSISRWTTSVKCVQRNKEKLMATHRNDAPCAANVFESTAQQARVETEKQGHVEGVQSGCCSCCVLFWFWRGDSRMSPLRLVKYKQPGGEKEKKKVMIRRVIIYVVVWGQDYARPRESFSSVSSAARGCAQYLHAGLHGDPESVYCA